MDSIMSYISTVGFPIVACCCIGYYVLKDKETERKESQAREERLYQQLDKNNETQNNICQTLVTISQRLEILEKKIELEKKQ